jgi:hypothetical protein
VGERATGNWQSFSVGNLFSRFNQHDKATSLLLSKHASKRGKHHADGKSYDLY